MLEPLHSSPIKFFPIPGGTKTHQPYHLGYKPLVLFRLANSFKLLRTAKVRAQEMSTMVCSSLNM